MQLTRQITVFFSFLAVLTITGGLLLALEPEPLAPVQQPPVMVMAAEPTANPDSVGEIIAEAPPVATPQSRGSMTGVITSGR